MDPDAPLEEQARGFAAALGMTNAGMIEKADFVKLREVSLTASAPSSLAQRFGVTRLALTLAGRNLATWTDYTGFDPEVNSQPLNLFSNSDFFTIPPLRTFSTRLTVQF